MTAAPPDLLTLRELPRQRLSRYALDALVAEGEYRRIAAGVFLREGVTDDTTAAWIAAAIKKPSATICLLSALALHDLTDEIPHATDLAVPRGVLPSRIYAAPVTWHRFDAATFDIGRRTYPLPGGVDIGLTSPERTLIDIFRLRHEWGVDLAVSALKAWLRAPGSDPAGLLSMATDFPQAKPALRSTLEVLL